MKLYQLALICLSFSGMFGIIGINVKAQLTTRNDQSKSKPKTSLETMLNSLNGNENNTIEIQNRAVISMGCANAITVALKDRSSKNDRAIRNDPYQFVWCEKTNQEIYSVWLSDFHPNMPAVIYNEKTNTTTHKAHAGGAVNYEISVDTMKILNKEYQR